VQAYMQYVNQCQLVYIKKQSKHSFLYLCHLCSKPHTHTPPHHPHTHTHSHTNAHARTRTQTYLVIVLTVPTGPTHSESVGFVEVCVAIEPAPTNTEIVTVLTEDRSAVGKCHSTATALIDVL